MFSRKYVFETKRTKLIRFLLNVLVGISVIMVIIVFIGAYIPLYSNSEADQANAEFFKKDPDLIAVYTGDTGRIDYTINLANKYKTTKILISGVYSANTVKSLIEKNVQLSPTVEQNLIESNRIEIDHVARNTMENVISTFHFLRTNKTYKKVLVVSNDYHIMRIKMIVEKIKTSKDPYEFYYKGIPTDYTQLRNIKVLYMEVIKYVKAKFFLILWDKESLSNLTTELP